MIMKDGPDPKSQGQGPKSTHSWEKIVEGIVAMGLAGSPSFPQTQQLELEFISHPVIPFLVGSPKADTHIDRETAPASLTSSPRRSHK